LNFLVPPTEEDTCFAKSPLQVAVEFKQYQLLLHPVFQRLIEVKWNSIGKWGALFYGIMNFIMNLLWTVRLCIIPKDAKQTYTGGYLQYSVAFDCLAVITLIALFISEAKQYFKAKRIAKQYREWRVDQLQRDLKHAHPRWPEERLYLEREIRGCEDYRSAYFRDKWNFLDWSTQILMLMTIVLHLCNVSIATNETNDWFRILSFLTLLSLWLRLLKYARPFRSVGLFVVMVSHVVNDTLRIVYLVSHIFIPFAAAFWMVFGIDGVEGYTLKNGALLYNIFQIGVVGDYKNDKLEAHAPITYQFLVGLFILLGNIVSLNLFIALLSNTFQRIYDNAKATAQMERAATILEMERGMSVRNQQKNNHWIIKDFAPEVLYYDDDAMEEEGVVLKRMTHQIRSRVEEVHDLLENQSLRQQTPLQMDNHNHTHQSQETLKTTEQLSHRENQDLKYLMESLNELRVDFYKSTIQTRAEIAGLGLMLKDVIDENTLHKTKKKKKENKGIYGEKDYSHKEKYDSNMERDNSHEEKEDSHVSTSSSSKQREDTPENDFYEGYTFSTQTQSNDDQLIKRTWGGIFTKMMEQRNPESSLDKNWSRYPKDQSQQNMVNFSLDENDVQPNASFNT